MTDHNPLADATEAELAEALALVRSRRQHADEETVFVRGEGGAVFEMAPSRMSADLRRRLQMGRLRRVTPDGRPYRPSYDEPEGAEVADGGSALTTGTVPRPAKSAPKKDWVLYAVAVLGLDEEEALAMTRQDLIDAPADHGQHAGLPPGTPVPAATGGRPAEDAPKAVWIDYVVRSGRMSREDAEAYTKDDLIALFA